MPAFKVFTTFEPNPERKWEHTPTMLGLVLYAGAPSRSRACSIANDVTSIRDKPGMENAINAVVAGSSNYNVMLNFDNDLMHCDCRSFEHREGPCKHITAVALRLVSDHEGGGPTYWARAAVLESRNAGDQFMLWENRPELTIEMGRAYDCEIVEVRQCIQKVTGYRLHNGKIWTGSLPLPLPGEEVLAYLPNRKQVPAVIVDNWPDDDTYQAYHVRLQWIPEGYNDENTVLFGAEMLRASNMG